MPKERTVALFDIKIGRDKKRKLKDLCIKENVTVQTLLEHVIDNLYETFYIGNKNLFRK